MNRFLTSYKCGGTDGYRLGSAALFDEYGGNAQNSDKEWLDAVVCPQGYSIGQSDQSGAEALCVAYLAPMGNYRKLFLHGIKPHTYLAMHLFPDLWDFKRPKQYYLQCPVEELNQTPNWDVIHEQIKESGAPYEIGKRTAHSRSYKTGWRTFIMVCLKQSKGRLVLNEMQGKTYLLMFDRLFCEIEVFQKEMVEKARETGVLHNMLGFPLVCDGIFTPSYERAIISAVPQSTVGCITHDAVIYTRNYARRNGKNWRLMSNKHDSHAWIFPDNDAKEVGKVMVKGLAAELTGRDGIQFTMKADFQVGKNWGKHHAKRNPQGLDKFDYK